MTTPKRKRKRGTKERCGQGHEKTPDNRKKDGSCKICVKELRKAAYERYKHLKPKRPSKRIGRPPLSFCGRGHVRNSGTVGRDYQCKECMWAKKLWYAYNLTVDQYEEMLRQQGGCCAICKGACTSRLAVDHCHETGKIRGLLCRLCNVGIGALKDSVEVLDRAKDYLLQHKAPNDG